MFQQFHEDRRLALEVPRDRVWLRPADLTPEQLAYTESRSLRDVTPRQEVRHGR